MSDLGRHGTVPKQPSQGRCHQLTWILYPSTLSLACAMSTGKCQKIGSWQQSRKQASETRVAAFCQGKRQDYYIYCTHSAAGSRLADYMSTRYRRTGRPSSGQGSTHIRPLARTRAQDKRRPVSTSRGLLRTPSSIKLSPLDLPPPLLGSPPGPGLSRHNHVARFCPVLFCSSALLCSALLCSVPAPVSVSMRGPS